MRRPTSIRSPMAGVLAVLMALALAVAMGLPRAAAATASNSRAPADAGRPSPAANPGEDPKPALGLEIRGAIGPAMAQYIEHGLEVAQRRGSPFVVLEIDTPGGLETSMREIISAILASPVPVVGYVAPPGARAASAGTYILYACHFAAMAPATNLGAATPVSIGGSEPAPPGNGPKKAGNAAAGAGQGTPMSAEQRKVLNDSIAYIRGLAQLRGRNADWAEQAVRGAASLPATQALQQHVIDFIAPDLTSLLTQLNGRETQIGHRMVRLDTRGVSVEWLRPDWRT
ncbi:MAG TPA: hypothetical protein VND24_02520, partial [Steroidobacteraceae bacterium]|nr:hypothetical protein [Steroidobacteraceae bacterium]